MNTRPVTFNGRLDVVKYALNSDKKIDVGRMMKLLNLNDEEIAKELAVGLKNPLFTINKPFNRHKGGFMYRLCHKFCIENFYGKPKNRAELRKNVYRIFDSVKYPEKEHKDLATLPYLSLEQLLNIFTDFKDQPAKIKLLSNLTKYKKVSYESLDKIAKSDYAIKLSKKYDKFEPEILEFLSKNGDEQLPSFLESLIKA